MGVVPRVDVVGLGRGDPLAVLKRVLYEYLARKNLYWKIDNSARKSFSKNWLERLFEENRETGRRFGTVWPVFAVLLLLFLFCRIIIRA